MGMKRLFRLMAALQTSAGPAVGQELDPLLPRVTASPPCERSSSSEIVVCGRRQGDSPYRIPKELREDLPRQREQSFSARMRDSEQVSRLEERSVGAFGFLQHSRKIDCEWRAARQEIQGQLPNCSLQIRPAP